MQQYLPPGFAAANLRCQRAGGGRPGHRGRLPEFNPLYSAASWYRYHIAHCNGQPVTLAIHGQNVEVSPPEQEPEE